MNRNVLQAGLAGTVGVLAIAVAAGSIDSAQSGGSGTGDGPSTATPSGIPDALAHAPETIETVPSFLFHFVWTIPLLSLITLFVVACVYYLYHDGLPALLSTFRFLIVLFVYTHLVVALVAGPYLASMIWGSGQGSDEQSPTGGPSFGEDGSSSFGAPVSSSGDGSFDIEAIGQFPLEAGVLLVCVVGLVVAVVLGRNGISDRLGSLVGGGGDPDLDSAASGEPRVASADEGVRGQYSPSHEPASNDVYRAWLSMTDAVAGSSRSTDTPTEIASRAVDAGVDERPVRELTDLFEDVRYGDGTPTPDREQYAVTLARRVTGETDRTEGTEVADDE